MLGLAHESKVELCNARLVLIQDSSTMTMINFFILQIVMDSVNWALNNLAQMFTFIYLQFCPTN